MGGYFNPLNDKYLSIECGDFDLSEKYFKIETNELKKHNVLSDTFCQGGFKKFSRNRS